MLTLPIKGKYFKMIENGVKKEEYRALTPYYKTRFKNVFEMYPYSYIPTGKDMRAIRLRNGYAAASPTLEVTCTLDIGKGRQEWGANPDEEYYILKILKFRRII